MPSDRGLPPLRQKKVARMGHGALGYSNHGSALKSCPDTRRAFETGSGGAGESGWNAFPGLRYAPAGAKSPLILLTLLARLKPCPCYKARLKRVFPRSVKPAIFFGPFSAPLDM